MRRTSSLLLALAVLLAACSHTEKSAGAVSTSSPSTTTTTTRPTTTTTEPIVLDGAPPELNDVIDSFYGYALGESDAAPPMPATLLTAINPLPGDRPPSGTASVAEFAGESVATVEVGTDLFLAVADENGWRIVGGEWPEFGVPSYYGAGPRVITVVGSDARPGEPMANTRADSIHFIGLDGNGSGAVVGLPRDSYVPVPGYGRRKITGSLALGGPDLMMQAFVDLTGLPLEGYILTGFAGFQTLIDSVLGGVEVEVPFAINDKAAKAALSAGLQVLDGFDALAFARARKTLPGGDFTRSEHQGKILIGAAKTVRELGPSAIPGLMEGAEPSIMTSLSPEQLLTFSVMAIRADLDAMPNQVAPGSAGSAGSASVVYLASSAQGLFDDLADGQLGN